jgi:hypothetical protein
MFVDMNSTSYFRINTGGGISGSSDQNYKTSLRKKSLDRYEKLLDVDLYSFIYKQN